MTSEVPLRKVERLMKLWGDLQKAAADNGISAELPDENTPTLWRITFLNPPINQSNNNNNNNEPMAQPIVVDLDFLRELVYLPWCYVVKPDNVEGSEIHHGVICSHDLATEHDDGAGIDVGNLFGYLRQIALYLCGDEVHLVRNSSSSSKCLVGGGDDGAEEKKKKSDEEPTQPSAAPAADEGNVVAPSSEQASPATVVVSSSSFSPELGRQSVIREHPSWFELATNDGSVLTTTNPEEGEEAKENEDSEEAATHQQQQREKNRIVEQDPLLAPFDSSPFSRLSDLTSALSGVRKSRVAVATPQELIDVLSTVRDGAKIEVEVTESIALDAECCVIPPNVSVTLISSWGKRIRDRLEKHEEECELCAMEKGAAAAAAAITTEDALPAEKHNGSSSKAAEEKDGRESPNASSTKGQGTKSPRANAEIKAQPLSLKTTGCCNKCICQNCIAESTDISACALCGVPLSPTLSGCFIVCGELLLEKLHVDGLIVAGGCGIVRCHDSIVGPTDGTRRSGPEEESRDSRCCTRIRDLLSSDICTVSAKSQVDCVVLVASDQSNIALEGTKVFGCVFAKDKSKCAMRKCVVAPSFNQSGRFIWQSLIVATGSEARLKIDNCTLGSRCNGGSDNDNNDQKKPQQQQETEKEEEEEEGEGRSSGDQTMLAPRSLCLLHRGAKLEVSGDNCKLLANKQPHRKNHHHQQHQHQHQHHHYVRGFVSELGGVIESRDAHFTVDGVNLVFSSQFAYSRVSITDSSFEVVDDVQQSVNAAKAPASAVGVGVVSFGASACDGASCQVRGSSFKRFKVGLHSSRGGTFQVTRCKFVECSDQALHVDGGVMDVLKSVEVSGSTFVRVEKGGSLNVDGKLCRFSSVVEEDRSNRSKSKYSNSSNDNIGDGQQQHREAIWAVVKHSTSQAKFSNCVLLYVSGKGGGGGGGNALIDDVSSSSLLHPAYRFGICVSDGATVTAEHCQFDCVPIPFVSQSGATLNITSCIVDRCPEHAVVASSGGRIRVAGKTAVCSATFVLAESGATVEVDGGDCAFQAFGSDLRMWATVQDKNTEARFTRCYVSGKGTATTTTPTKNGAATTTTTTTTTTTYKLGIRVAEEASVIAEQCFFTENSVNTAFYCGSKATLKISQCKMETIPGLAVIANGGGVVDVARSTIKACRFVDVLDGGSVTVNGEDCLFEPYGNESHTWAVVRHKNSQASFMKCSVGISTGSYQFGVSASDDATVTADQCTFDYLEQPFSSKRGAQLFISRCVVDNCLDYALHVANSGKAVVSNNCSFAASTFVKVEDGASFNIDGDGCKFETFGNDSPTIWALVKDKNSRAKFRNCSIVGLSSSTNETYDQGIVAAEGATAIVEKCCFDCVDKPFTSRGGATVSVSQCQVENCRGCALHVDAGSAVVAESQVTAAGFVVVESGGTLNVDGGRCVFNNCPAGGDIVTTSTSTSTSTSTTPQSTWALIRNKNSFAHFNECTVGQHQQEQAALSSSSSSAAAATATTVSSTSSPASSSSSPRTASAYRIGIKVLDNARAMAEHCKFDYVRVPFSSEGGAKLNISQCSVENCSQHAVIAVGGTVDVSNSTLSASLCASTANPGSLDADESWLQPNIPLGNNSNNNNNNNSNSRTSKKYIQNSRNSRNNNDDNSFKRTDLFGSDQLGEVGGDGGDDAGINDVSAIEKPNLSNINDQSAKPVEESRNDIIAADDDAAALASAPAAHSPHPPSSSPPLSPNARQKKHRGSSKSP